MCVVYGESELLAICCGDVTWSPQGGGSENERESGQTAEKGGFLLPVFDDSHKR